jgi:integrase
MRAPNKTNEEFAEVYSYISENMQNPQMYRLMLLLTQRLGLRPMEIAGLERKWFRGDELRIPLGHSKRKAGRSLPVDAEVLEALAAHMGEREGVVFLNQRHQPFSAQGISDALRRVYREAGQLGSAYSGRRTLASNLVERGVNILIISKVLGHSNVSTTQEYVSVTDNMMRNALSLA